eukprot:TRINITY_DN16965_c0_g1_i1.p1 TRINITY_DN16965_c0_g1~~TRINITY_DN16965_c0_g1_i1.p1  ORF type:complete len:180 (-),score=40.72 TRINITY_DN16965_c0_g1_i1:45-584(-)
MKQRTSLFGNPLLKQRKKTRKPEDRPDMQLPEGDDLDANPASGIAMPIEENLTEEDKNANIKRMLSRINPQAAHNIAIYSFKDSIFKKNDDVSQLVVHFALNEDFIKTDSEEANLQITIADLKNSVEERKIKELNEGIAYEKTEESVEQVAAEQKKSLRNQFNFSDRSAVVYALSLIHI